MAVKPIKVLFLLNSSGGGASQGIYEFLQTVSKNEVQAFVVVPDNPDEAKQERLSALCRDWRTVPTAWWNRKTNLPRGQRWKLSAKSQLKTLFHVIPLMRIIALITRWRIDIVYTGTSLNIEGALAAKLTGRPHIWHIKETFGPRGRVKFPLNEKRLSRFFLKYSKRVIVMTEYIRSFFHPELSADRRIEVVYDGIHLEDFRKAGCGHGLRTDLRLSEKDLLVAMVASLSSTWKKHHLFVEMARKLHDQGLSLKYVMFGPLPKEHHDPTYNKPWEYYQNLMSMLKQHPVGQDFIWAGFHNNIPQLMDAIDILVHPCDIEPFGRIAIEAQAAGTVVVGPNVGGIAESVSDQYSGLLVDPDNPEALAAAVARLARDKELRATMGQNGQDHVKNTFPQSKHNSLILDIFNDISQAKQ